MDCPKLLPRYGNHCEICKSLDYEMFEDKLVKKSARDRSEDKLVKKERIAVEKPVKLSQLPRHLLDSVLIKMNYSSFTKFRSTNKAFSEYIDQNRAKLRIAIFHDMSLEAAKGNVYFSRKWSPYSEYSGMSIEEENERVLEKKYENGSIAKQSFPFNLRININQFLNNADVQKEFYGCYKPHLVHISSVFKSQSLKETISFLEWAQIKNVTFVCRYFNLSLLLQLSGVLQPRTLKLNALIELPVDSSLSMECFKQTRAVELNFWRIALQPQLWRNVEYFCVKNVVNKSDLYKILQRWKHGEVALKEMWIQIEQKASLSMFSPISISREASWKHVKQHMTYLELWKFKKARHFILEQDKTGKKAYCMRGSEKIQVDSIQSYCQALGANIISITSEAEKDFIASLTKTGLSTPMYLQPLIGAYRDTETSPWKWRDGTVFAQSHWFFQDKITKDRNCAYLLVDKTVDVFGRGSTDPKDIYHNGNTGGFSTGHCTNIGNVVICKKRDTTDRRTEKKCGSTWTALDSSCYKYFSEPNIQIGQANDYCKRHGANLVSIATEKEKEFLISITTKSQYAPVNWQTAVGCYRDSSNRWKWYDGTPFEQSSFFYPVQNDTDNCCMLLSDVPTRIGITLLPKPEHFYFNQVTGKILKAKCSWPAYQFICEKKACDLSVSTFSNGRCECNKGYVDITETTSLEASKYQKGEKCIPDRCRVKDDTSVLFMLDSSDSITAKHWPKLVNFVTDAAVKLPKSYRIGFLRFSTNVTFEKFVKPGWNVKQIKEAVPTLYEAGGTNTPAALKHAQKIFEDVRSKNKIAVLITDGLPFAEKEYDSEAEALNATVTAAEELREDGVRLIVMGVGPKICDNADEVKKWVRNPKQDYFLLRHNVKSLKSKDMEKLLKIVCN